MGTGQCGLLPDLDYLPDPDFLAVKIVDSIEASLENFKGIISNEQSGIKIGEGVRLS